MRKSQLVGACAIVAMTALTARAQQDAATATVANQPRLEVPEVSFNFGYVPQGASIAHTFWLRNVGGDTLRITDVRPG